MAEPEVSAPISVEHDGWTIFANDGVTSESDITSALGAESSPADDAPIAPVSDPAEDAPPAPVEAKDGMEPPAEEPEAEAKPAEDAKPKRELTAKEQKREAQARINAAVREQREAERLAAAKDAELAEAKRELEALKAGKPSSAAQDATPAELATMPSWEAYQADGKGWDDYTRDKAKWDLDTIEARIARREQEIVERVRKEEAERIEREGREKEYAEIKARHAAYLQAHPEVEDVRSNLDDIESTPFMAAIVNFHPKGPQVFHHWAQHPDECRALSQIDVAPALMTAIRTSDDPIPLLSHIANTPDEMARLLSLPADQALLSIGRLLSRLEGAKTGSPSAVPVTRATAPMRPVVGGRSSGDRDDEPVTEATDFATWWAKDDAKQARKAR